MFTACGHSFPGNSADECFVVQVGLCNLSDRPWSFFQGLSESVGPDV